MNDDDICSALDTDLPAVSDSSLPGPPQAGQPMRNAEDGYIAARHSALGILRPILAAMEDSKVLHAGSVSIT
ncbi:hypothetical protein [Synechococcus sp. CBW1006]|jgi:hypothetical protein|uniref:hypothetical protein n=1 Tax=Synechococcus sp. CBW1006 TaxID=1353138 RepID=UPI0018CD34B1|nr:hypothetical protein [Synechococcus sp. CBW1006]QPN67538.1 hypothetical protein H8F26_04970 [Synechococcus sp. CBW1006]CAK6687103.1 hypothetical protein IFHNHDMJ_00132 [Synechococcus sp. CBW1107]